MKILGIAGSLRRGSYNRALIEAARELAPAGMRIEPFDLDDIPLYNADFDVDGLLPAEVQRLKHGVAAADGLLIATPEYNHSVPGVLQNHRLGLAAALNSPLVAKPVAIMSASPGPVGAARAQQQLKRVLLSTLALLMPHPGVTVGQAAEKFDAANSLVHQPTRPYIAAFLKDLESWVHRVSPVTSHQ